MSKEPTEYSISTRITAERGVGYICLQPQNRGAGCVKRTFIARNSRGEEAGIHIDFDHQGRIFGIEVMDDSLPPPPRLRMNSEQSSSSRID